MMMISLASLTFVQFLWSTSAQCECYVKPDNTSFMSCPAGQLCLTLDQYAQEAVEYFTTGSTFLFLPGNHTLQTTIKLTNISDLKFKRSRSTEQDSIIHGNRGKIIFMGVINLTIDGLTLKTTNLEVIKSKDIMISNSTFLGNASLTNYSRSALACINSTIRVINCHFEENTGKKGGAISIDSTNLDLVNSTFIRNKAHREGGAIYANRSNVTVTGNLMHDFNDSGTSVTFSCNSASNGGAIFLNRTNAVFIRGHFLLQDNMATESYGGGIFSIKSDITFQKSSTLLLSGNCAHKAGGAIRTVYGTIQLLSRKTTFAYNSAENVGGAMYGSNTDMHFHGSIIFSHNSAYIGGGMYFTDVSLQIMSGMKLNASFNNASAYGGAIYYEDTLTRYQCVTDMKYTDNLPYCFIELTGTDLTHDTSVLIYSYYNTAGNEGSFLYGGSLDRCQLKSTGAGSAVKYSTNYKLLESKFLLQPNNSIYGISSYPYKLCPCGKTTICDKGITINNIYRGQTFTVSLYALAQAGNHVLTTVTAKMSVTARLESNQTYQKLSQQYNNNNCSSLVYNLYSTEAHEELKLYPDGPCGTTSYISFPVEFLPCPPGFIQSNDECICEQRLMKYTTTCTIDKDSIISIMRNSGSKFWMTSFYENETYKGLILCETCPAEYCKTKTVAISLDNPDMQCALNRSGVLCGACIANHSLMLGSSRCYLCPNTYLALLLPFAAAGIALVVFLSILRLTVATGMINSVILYANIVHVNRHLFFPINTGNVLTVFIAWMNLDLGIETCFYNGMTVYAQNWLQFAFPFYIWILISLIITTSRYSVRVSKLIGHNPIAVLATLLLMSYTKILKVIFDVYYSAQLEYPNNKTVTVWLKDGNITYLWSRHFLLIVMTSLVLVFLFLPYTLLLLLGYKLYRFSGKKNMRWLNKLKPLLDSYYAPYNKKTRFWSGFLLLVRCGLYVVFSFRDGNKNLLAITITFVIILLAFALLPGRIYTSFYKNIIESLVYSNLIILSGVIFSSGPGANSSAAQAMVYLLVGMVFLITMSIIVYHFHTLFTAHSLMLRIQAKISKFIHHLKISKKEDELISEFTPNEVTTTVIELREPLLET